MDSKECSGNSGSVPATLSKESKEDTKLIAVRFFCGKDTQLKRYESYFRNKLTLLNANGSSDIAICHSLGIKEALKSNAKYIIAMDPTIISDDKRVYNWLPESRVSQLSNVQYYKMSNPSKTGLATQGMEERSHYPYESKPVRDKIVKLVQNLHKTVIS